MSLAKQTILPPSPQVDDTVERLRARAIASAAAWGSPKRVRWPGGGAMKRHWRQASESIREAMEQHRASGSRRLLVENNRLLRTVIRESAECAATCRGLPHVDVDSNQVLP